MNERRFKATDGRRWTIRKVDRALAQMGIALAPTSRRTSAQAVDILIATGESLLNAGLPDRAIVLKVIETLDASGLRPAYGGKWRDVTVRRLLERHIGLSTKPQTDEERFDAKVRPGPGGCLIWTGAKQIDRGKLEVGGAHQLAYRFSYEREHGPGSIPEGYHLHHTCKRPECVAVGHLVPVSPAEHRKLELEEQAINDAALDGTLRAELDELAATDDPDAWLPQPQRVGAIRSRPRKPLATARTD